VCFERIVAVELSCHLRGQTPLEAASHVDLGELPELRFGKLLQLLTLPGPVRVLGIPLGAD
jgi:hypothetical protein